jgi:UDP-3-O-[3-hydroxymyristoyl] N-acetylglucosamine deacetylase
VGLHTGVSVRARLLPQSEPGIVFARTDQGGARIRASWSQVTRTVHATMLEENGVSVLTTEHLLASLWAMDVTNCTVELDGPEVPILDGSAEGWCDLIRRAGVVEAAPRIERPVYTLDCPVWVEEGAGSVLALPHRELRVTVLAAFPGLEPQAADNVVDAERFPTELAPARTFTLEEWIEPLRAQGLIQGGSTDNALVLTRGVPSAPYRFENELARHKALDVVGDIALLFAGDGGLLRAHFIATRAGHGLHRKWMEECMRLDALVRCA